MAEGVEQGPIIVTRVAREHDEYGSDKVIQALAIDRDLEVDNAFVVGKAHVLAEILHDGMHPYPRHGVACDSEVREAMSIGHDIASVAKAVLGIVAHGRDGDDLMRQIWEELANLCDGHLDKHTPGQVVELAIGLGEIFGRLTGFHGNGHGVGEVVCCIADGKILFVNECDGPPTHQGRHGHYSA